MLEIYKNIDEIMSTHFAKKVTRRENCIKYLSLSTRIVMFGLAPEKNGSCSVLCKHTNKHILKKPTWQFKCILI